MYGAAGGGAWDAAASGATPSKQPTLQPRHRPLQFGNHSCFFTSQGDVWGVGCDLLPAPWLPATSSCRLPRVPCLFPASSRG